MVWSLMTVENTNIQCIYKNRDQGWQIYWDRRDLSHRYRDSFQGSGACGTPIRVGYVSDKPTHGKSPGEF